LATAANPVEFRSHACPARPTCRRSARRTNLDPQANAQDRAHARRAPACRPLPDRYRIIPRPRQPLAGPSAVSRLQARGLGRDPDQRRRLDESGDPAGEYGLTHLAEWHSPQANLTCVSVNLRAPSPAFVARCWGGRATSLRSGVHGYTIGSAPSSTYQKAGEHRQPPRRGSTGP
jgi:hypothetical protein